MTMAAAGNAHGYWTAAKLLCDLAAAGGRFG